MNDQIAAVTVAIVTGGFGLLGILATQLLAKKNVKHLNPSEKEEVAAIMGDGHVANYSHIAALQHMVKENGINAREGVSDIREAISDIKIEVREMRQEIRHEFDRLGSKD